MKKTLYILLIIFIIFGGFVARASSNEISVYVDNEKINFDVAPVIISGRTMVPVRAIFEHMGATVNWNEATQTVTAKKDNKTVSIKIGSDEITVNTNKYEMDCKAIVINNRTLVPARYVAESLDYIVEWDNNEKKSSNIHSKIFLKIKL